VEITVYNILGQHIRQLAKEQQVPGEYRFAWDGKNDKGLQQASGVYVLQLKVGATTHSLKSVLLL
jgi:flagellar hook assembly protein FlgD